jgi:hypothetical protein
MKARDVGGGMSRGEPEPPQADTPRSAVLLERFFITGLQYLSQGVGMLTKLREKLGNNSSAAKTMIGLAMDQLRLALGEFNIYLERQSEVLKDEESQGIEIEQIRRLLDEYREELENVKDKNRELRELLALKMDGRDKSREYPDEDYDHEINHHASRTKVKDSGLKFINQHRDAEWGNSRIDEVTFGKNRAPARMPVAEEMFKSSHTLSKALPVEENVLDRHNRSYMSINLDKGFEGHFGKKTKPHMFGSHGKKIPPKTNNYYSEGFKNLPGNMKGSNFLGTVSDQLGTLQTVQGIGQSRVLEEEISQLDARILSLMSEVYDEFKVDLRTQGDLL